MLVLSRKAGESICIGESITITVEAIKGNKVQLGISAPKDVAVHREEIWRLIHRNQVVDDAAAMGKMIGEFEAAQPAPADASADAPVDAPADAPVDAALEIDPNVPLS